MNVIDKLESMGLDCTTLPNDIIDALCDQSIFKVKGGKKVAKQVSRTEKEITGKLAPQAKICLESLPEGEIVTMREWADLADEAGLVTKQGADRIVAYYRGQLVDAGYIELH